MTLVEVPPTSAPAARRPDLRHMFSARSVVAGRQRWDVPATCGRPDLARLIAGFLNEDEDILEARANPVTGRVLVVHDPATSPHCIAGRVREAVTRCLVYAQARADRTPASADAASLPATVHPQRDTSAHGVASRGPGGLPTPTRSCRRRRNVALVGAGAAALAIAAGSNLVLGLLASPVISLGLTAAATAAVVRRAWRRSDRTRQQTDGPARRRHPLRSIIGGHKRQFGVATALSALSQLTELALYALVPSAALLLATSHSATLVAAGATTQLSVLAGAIALTFLVTAGLSYGAGVAWRRLGQTVEDDWRIRTYAHVQRVAPADLENERTSRVVAVLGKDISQLGDFVGTNLHEAVQLVTSLAVLVPVYLLVAPQIAWVAFAPVPLVVWLSFRFRERAVADHAASGEHRARLNSRMADNLEAHTTIKAACTEQLESARIAELSRKHGDANRAAGRHAAAQAQTLRLAGGSVLVGTIVLGGRSVLNGGLSSAAFGPLIEVPGIALLRLSRVGNIIDGYQHTAAALDRVQHLHDLPVEPGTEGRQLPPRQINGQIELRKVTFAYPGRAAALRDTSLVIDAGRTTGIVGTTGAGKTTIAKLLMRFRHADAGQVLFDGADVRTLALPDLRRAIGYVAQEPFLFDSTVAENISYGTHGATPEQLIAAARAAGAHTFIEALPDGYETPVGERGAALSGGQKQRIALARTILRNPPVVILDEATSAVDNETEAAIQHALQVFARNRTMIVIAHRLSAVRSADRIYVLGPGGLVAEQGTHDELVARGGTYATLWSLQAGQTGVGLTVGPGNR